MKPFWLIPGGLAAKGFVFEFGSAAACPRKSPVDAIGAILHLPQTHSPTRRPKPPCHSPLALADGFGEEELPAVARPESIEIEDADAESLAERRFDELAFTSTMLASSRDEGRVLLGVSGLGEKPPPRA
jgi:hypothetical protein